MTKDALETPSKTNLAEESALKLDKKSISDEQEVEQESESNSEENAQEINKFMTQENLEKQDDADEDDDISEIQNLELDSKKEPLLPQPKNQPEDKAKLG